jgi:hypothetical protein
MTRIIFCVEKSSKITHFIGVSEVSVIGFRLKILKIFYWLFYLSIVKFSLRLHDTVSLNDLVAVVLRHATLRLGIRRNGQTHAAGRLLFREHAELGRTVHNITGFHIILEESQQKLLTMTFFGTLMKNWGRLLYLLSCRSCFRSRGVCQLFSTWAFLCACWATFLERNKQISLDSMNWILKPWAKNNCKKFILSSIAGYFRLLEVHISKSKGPTIIILSESFFSGSIYLNSKQIVLKIEKKNTHIYDMTRDPKLNS